AKRPPAIGRGSWASRLLSLRPRTLSMWERSKVPILPFDYNRLVNAAARSGAGYLIAALSVAGITFVGYRWLHLNPTTVALAFLLSVLGISASWGFRQAVFLSVIATVAFDYFFLPPIGAFTIADPQNWIALIAFLVTAAAVSELSPRALPSSAGWNWNAFTPSASCCFPATIRPSC